MSVHVSSSEEAQAVLLKHKRKNVAFSIVISFLVTVLLGVILALLSIAIPVKTVDQLITYAAPVEETTEDIVKPKVNTSRQVPTPPSSSAAVANVITTSTFSDIQIPDTDLITNMDSTDFGEIDDFGDGFGDFGDGFGAKAGESTLFGSSGGKGLKGVLYDLKQTPQREPSDLAHIFSKKGSFQAHIKEYQSASKELIRKGYSKFSLEGYYKASKPLSFNYLIIPDQNAAIGPKSFGAEKEIEPKAWLAVYEGKFAEDVERPFRFMGRFDDVLIVFLNDRIVLDGCFQDGYTSKFKDMDDHPDAIPMRGIPDRMSMGDYVKPRKGDKLRIIVGEIPGGGLGGGLFIEEKGVKNPGLELDGLYRPIPFSTVYIDADEKLVYSTGNSQKRKASPVWTEEVPVYRFQD